MWPTDNMDSWRRIREFIDEFPDDERWLDWKRIAKSLISSLTEEHLDRSLRIGQSMSHIIFSTIDHHRLYQEPRVTVEIREKDKKLRFAYSTSNLWFNEPIEEITVYEADALLVAKHMLRKLWLVTKPGMEVPDALREA